MAEWRQLQRQLRLAARSREPVMIHLPDVVADEAMVRAATVSGVRYGPSDLRAPREFYRFEWGHERVLWIGCLLSERVKRIRGGTICYDVLCPLGRLTPEVLRCVVQYLREGAKPEADPELLDSLRGTPLAEVDVFLEVGHRFSIHPVPPAHASLHSSDTRLTLYTRG